MKNREQLQEQLDTLRKENAALQSKMTRVINQIKKIDEARDKDIISNIDLSNMTPEDWKFVLHHFHDDTDVKYQFSSDIFYSMYMWSNGFWPETKQHSISILENTIETVVKRKEWLKNFATMLPHMLPVKVKKAGGSYVTLYIGVSQYVQINKAGKVRILSEYSKGSWKDLNEDFLERLHGRMYYEKSD